MAQDIKFDKVIKSEDLILEHWWVDEGEIIYHDQQIASVRDGNQIYLIKAPFEGILFKKYKHNNESFDKNEPLGRIISKEEAGNIRINGKLGSTERKIIDSIHKEEDQVRNRVYVKASPSARRKAQQEDINLEYIKGTGPGGRIQLRDVNEYIKEHSPSVVFTNYKNKTVKYGLPLTGLAKRLARKHNLDVSKIPAPPGAHRIRRRDVERYLKNPEGAEAEIELEYNIHQTSNLENPVIVKESNLPASTEIKEIKKEEPTVIRLTTEEPNEVPISDRVINLETAEEPMSLETSQTGFLLMEPEENEEVTIIRLSTDEDNIVPAGEQINLDTQELTNLLLDFPVILSLDSPALNDGSVIRLYTSEESVIPSDMVFNLGVEPEEEIKEERVQEEEVKEEKNQEEKIVNEPILLIEQEAKEEVKLLETTRAERDEEDILKTLKAFKKKQDRVHEELREDIADLKKNCNGSSNIAQLSTLVNLNLIELVKKYNPPTKEIGGFLKNYILSVIYQVFNEEFINLDNIYYMADIQNEQISFYSSSDIDEIGKDIIGNYNKYKLDDINDGECIIVELLGYNLSSVSGLINPEKRIVLYLTYSKGLDRFFYEPVNIRSVLKLTLEFDKEYLQAGYALKLIEALRTKLEG